MLVKVQDEYRSQFLEAMQGPDSGPDSFYALAETAGAGDLIVGNLEYLLKNRGQTAKLLIADDAVTDMQSLHLISHQSRLYVAESQPASLREVLNSIKNRAEKNQQVAAVKSEIQRKRRELEDLNSQLSSESERKIQSLEKLHIEETEKNQNEKSLLHFLDFIQSESASDDFLEKLFRFVWKDLKKIARVHLLGFSMNTASGKSKILFYDGYGESTSLTPQLDFTAERIASQLATAWGRPVGKIAFWQLPEISRESFFFLETVDPLAPRERLDSYFNERIAILSMYLDRWMIEKEIEVVVDRWRNTFRSFPGFTHVVDDNFRIYQSNYPHRSEEYCYKVLAGRESPCESCPILKNKDTSFMLREGVSVKTYFSQFKFQARKYYFVIYEDVTKRNQLHMNIIQTEKMSTLGRLGNHLAHELNNPLAGIKSYVQTLLEDTSAVATLPSTATSDLSEILKATVRCQKIIKNFIDFSQKKEPSLESISFSEVLQNTIVLLKTALRSHRLFIDLQENIVRANSHDLQQVLFNIIKNSCQAMGETGTLKIYSEEAGDKLLFHFEDTGPGFDENILKNIFHPFMTTKQQGEGTGLGLYLSKKLMNNMGADLQVTSSSQKGAKISLVFDKI